VPAACAVLADVRSVRRASPTRSRRPTRRGGAQTPIRAGPSTSRTPTRAADTLRRVGRRHSSVPTTASGVGEHPPGAAHSWPHTARFLERWSPTAAAHR